MVSGSVTSARTRRLRPERRGRLHSAIGYVTPADKLEGHAEQIFAERDRKLAEAADRLAGKFGKGALLPARIANRSVRDGTRGRGGSQA